MSKTESHLDPTSELLDMTTVDGFSMDTRLGIRYKTHRSVSGSLTEYNEKYVIEGVRSYLFKG